MVFALCGKGLKAPGWAVAGKPSTPGTYSGLLC